MGFLSGILDAASHAVGPTLNLMAGRAQGQAIAQQRQQQQLLQAYALQRQQQQDALARAMAQSTMQGRSDLAKHYANQDTAANARNALGQKHEDYLESQPKAPVLGTPEYLKAQEDVTKMKAKYRPAPQNNFTFPVVMGPNGQPVVARASTKTGDITLTDVGGKPTSSQGGGSAPVSQRAMFMGEVARKAADVLPFLATGHIGLLGAAARDVAHEGIFGAPGSKDLGNFAMNHIDPKLAAYNAGTAELTLNAGHALGGVRGGSESQMKQLGQSLELHSGDTPVAREQKIRNVADLLSSMFASLPPDLRQLQYASLGAQRIALLRQYGFDPEHAIPLQYIDPGAVAASSQGQPTGNIDLGAPPSTGFDAKAFYTNHMKSKKP